MPGLGKDGARLVLASVAYFALARIGLAFASVSDVVTFIWAPAGLGLAFLVLWGPKMLWAIVAGQLAVGVSLGSAPTFVIGAALAACAEALAATAILRRSGFVWFRHGGDVLRLVSAGAVAAAVGAALGTGALAAVGDTAWSTAFQTWWLGDFLGVLVVAPLILTFSPDDIANIFSPGSRRFEVASWLLVFAGTFALIFADPLEVNQFQFALAFLLLPVVAWAAYRFGLLGAAFANLQLAGVVLSATLLDAGPFASGDIDSGLALTSIFVGVTAVSSLQLAVVVGAQDAAERALRENLSWLDLTQTTAQVGTWSWDAETNDVRASEAFLRLFGLSQPTGRPSIARFAGMLHPDDRAAVTLAALHTHQSGETSSLEFRIVHPSGEIRWYAMKAVRALNDPTRADSAFRTVGINVDITDTRRLQEAVRRNERLASLGTFAAGLAHEINNPVGGILLAAHAAQAHVERGGMADGALDDIIEDAERAGRIVKSILQFSKTKASEHAPHDLNACARSARRLTLDAAAQKGVTVHLNLGHDPLIAECNATEIEQVIVNLIQNSIAASPEESSIRIDSQLAGDSALIRVTDKGSGMPESVRRHAFDPFYTTRTNEGGSGLGLSICHGIIESHEGEISIASQEDIGTTVELSLPLTRTTQ